MESVIFLPQFSVQFCCVVRLLVLCCQFLRHPTLHYRLHKPRIFFTFLALFLCVDMVAKEQSLSEYLPSKLRYITDKLATLWLLGRDCKVGNVITDKVTKTILNSIKSEKWRLRNTSPYIATFLHFRSHLTIVNINHGRKI